MFPAAGLVHGLALLTGSAAAGESSPIWSFETRLIRASPEALVIEFDEAGSQPQAASIIENEVPGQQLSPIGIDILSSFAPRTFGAEERVQVSSEAHGLTIICMPGDRPAGVVLSSGASYLPRFMSGSIEVDGRGATGLRAALIRPDADMPDNALQLQSGRTQIPLQRSTSSERDQSLAILCPTSRASFTIRGLRVVPRPVVRAGRFGTWLWNPRQWTSVSPEIARLSAGQRVDELALQLPVQGGSVVEPAGVTKALADLQARGRTLVAVEGDPDMVTPEGLAHAVARVRAIRAFNDGQPRGSRIGALELDIEPYSRPAYRLDSVAVWRSWAHVVAALSKAWGGKVLIDVPFWMLGADGGSEAIEAVRPVIAGVIVMAYRTDPAQLPPIVEPWLAWGAEQGVPVRIALESGHVGPELHRTYRRADSGTVVLRSQPGRALVSLYAAPIKDTPGGPTYRLSHETRVDPARISFLGAAEPRNRAISTLLPLLRSWPSFAGLRVHGLWDEALPAPGAASQ